MRIDLAYFAGVLLSIASLVISIAIPILVPSILQRIGVANDADLTAKLERAANAAAGLAYQYAAAQSGGLGSFEVHNAALSVGERYISTHLPSTLATLNLSSTNIREMVSARLGVLLAGDPSVTAGKPVAGNLPGTPSSPSIIDQPLPSSRHLT